MRSLVGKTLLVTAAEGFPRYWDSCNRSLQSLVFNVSRSTWSCLAKWLVFVRSWCWGRMQAIPVEWMCQVCGTGGCRSVQWLGPSALFLAEVGGGGGGGGGGPRGPAREQSYLGQRANTRPPNNPSRRQPRRDSSGIGGWENVIDKTGKSCSVS